MVHEKINHEFMHYHLRNAIKVHNSYLLPLKIAVRSIILLNKISLLSCAHQWNINPFSMHINHDEINMEDKTYLWSMSSICPSTMLDPPKDRSTKIENSFSLSCM